MKIIFCGPPHSGKSVLIDSLRQYLPSDGFYIDRIHLDGEGTWSNNPDQNMVQSVRQKEDYDEKFIRQKCKELSQYNNFPIVLVDIGGKLLNDKIPIFESCDAFVVVCNDTEEYKEYALRWFAFGTKYHCKCLAILQSQLNGKEEIFGTTPFLTGKITKLERGKHEAQSPRITQALADIIIKESKYSPKYRTEPNVIDFNKVAVDAKIARERTTGFNQKIYFADYPIDNAQTVYAHLEKNYPLQNQCLIYGARPNWLTAMTSIMYDKKGCKDIQVFDMNTMEYIKINHLPKVPLNEIQNGKLSFTLIDCDNYVFLHLSITSHGGIINPKTDYPNFVIPQIPEDKPLYFSGKAPMWLLDSIMISYDSPIKYVHQPGEINPWLCCYNKQNQLIGTTKKDPDDKVPQFFEELKKKNKKESDRLKAEANSKKSTETEIERTFLVDENIVLKQGKYKHTVEHTFIQEADGSVVRMSNKWGTDNIHKYKRTMKIDIELDDNQNGEQNSSIRKEINKEISEDEYNSYIEYNKQFILGHAISEVYDMPDNFTALIRHFDNNKIIITAEIEFKDKDEEKDFVIPNWCGNEVSHDDAYRGKNMAITNFVK